MRSYQLLLYKNNVTYKVKNAKQGYNRKLKYYI